MSHSPLSDDRDHIGRQAGRAIIHSIWSDGVRFAQHRHDFRDRGRADIDNAHPDIDTCNAYGHRLTTIDPPSGHGTHTHYCDVCRIRFTTED